MVSEKLYRNTLTLAILPSFNLADVKLNYYPVLQKCFQCY